MRRKRIICLSVISAMLFLVLYGCGTSETVPPSTQPPSPEPTATPSAAPVVPAVTVPEGAVDFSDGLFDFLLINETPGDADSSRLSVVEGNGASRLKIEVVSNKAPYLAIDASSLLGERVVDLRAMEMSVTLENPDGSFYASSGVITAFSGEKRVESSDKWVIYMETHNPRVIRAELDESELFIPDAHNFFVFNKQSDAAVDALKTANNIYINYIAFYDADGNILPVDSSVSFNAPTGYGKLDWSGLFTVANPVIIPDSEGKGAAGQAAVTLEASAGALDPALLVPGSVLTVHYASLREPYITWDNGSVKAPVKALYTNTSGTISQFTYEELVEINGSADFSNLASVSFGNPDGELVISKISVGANDGEAPTALIPVKDGVTIPNSSGSSNNAWVNIVSLDTTRADEANPIDVSLIGPGTVFVVVYESELSPWLIWQSWTEGMPEDWAQTNTTLLENGIAQWTFEQMVEVFLTDDVASFLDKIHVCGHASIKVTKLRICQTR